MTIEQRIKNCIERHPDWDDSRIASATRGSTRAAIKAVRSGIPVSEGMLAKAKPEEPAPAAGQISIAQIRHRYDIAARIRAELEALPAGALILERELCQKTAGKDAARFRRTVENAEDLKAYRVKLKLDPDQPEGAFYWGKLQDVREAQRLRDE